MVEIVLVGLGCLIFITAFISKAPKENGLNKALTILALVSTLFGICIVGGISKATKPDYQIELDHNNIHITDKQGNDTVISADSSIDKFIEYDQR